eukprot:jgi/Astpho2/5045/Aster-x0232
MGKQDPSTGSTSQKVLDAPCSELYQASLKCLDKNNYTREACVEHYKAYKNCKQQEIETRKERRLEAQKGRKGWFS